MPPNRTEDELAALPPFPHIPGPAGYSLADYWTKFHEWQWKRFLETPEEMMSRIMGTPVTIKPVLSAGVTSSDPVRPALLEACE